MTCITGSPCSDPTCYRGGVGDWNYQYKDGPCARADCAWPWQIQDTNGAWSTVDRPEPWDMFIAGIAALVRRLPPRPHFTDTPATPIVDAGRVAREALAADAVANAHAEQICAAENRRILTNL